MRSHHWTKSLCTVLTAMALTLPVAESAGAQGRRAPRERPRLGLLSRQLTRELNEPAFARGYADGYQRGLADGRSRNRYDPVASRAYRSGDEGYSRAYGSREGYKNNYRAGFRQGYEAGYREASR